MFFALDIVFFCAFCLWVKELFADWFARSGEKDRRTLSERKAQRPFRFVTPLGDSLKKGGKPRQGGILRRAGASSGELTKCRGRRRVGEL